jgi:site-specific recombinase XerD
LSYRDTFSLLLRFCRDEVGIPPEKLSFSHITRELIEGFLVHLRQARGCSSKTANQRLAAIHAFFRYLQTETPEELLRCQQILATPFIKTVRESLVEHISLEAVQAILAEPDTKSLKGRRDLTMLALLYDTGARVSEVIGICVRDVRIDSPATVKLLGKGSKARVVPLMNQTRDLLSMYMDDQGLTAMHLGSKPLFFNQRGEKLTRFGVAYVLDKYVESAKMKHSSRFTITVSPHVFRHSKAMHLLQNGVNLIYIRDLLGHVNINTTEVYARADEQMKRKAMESAYDNPTPTDLAPWQKDASLLNWLQNLGK